jgi:hypothetical protein
MALCRGTAPEFMAASALYYTNDLNRPEYLKRHPVVDEKY